MTLKRVNTNLEYVPQDHILLGVAGQDVALVVEYGVALDSRAALDGPVRLRHHRPQLTHLVIVAEVLHVREAVVQRLGK